MFFNNLINKKNFLVFFLAFIISNSVLLVSEEVPPPSFEKELYDSKFIPQKVIESRFKTNLLKDIEKMKFALGAEVLHSFTTPTTNMTGSKSDIEKKKDEMMLNALMDFQSFEGIEYYSNKRKKYREFLIESYRVASVKDKTKLSDVTVAEITPQVDNELDSSVYKVHWFRKDSSFGSGVLEYSIFYNSDAHEIYGKLINLETIRYNNIIPIGNPRDMSVNVIISRKDDTYTMYFVGGAAGAVPFKSMREKVAISLMYRLYATAVAFENTLREKYKD